MMKINAQQEPSDYLPLINDLLVNLELEHAGNWLLEAIEAVRNDYSRTNNIRHLYQTALFDIYVNFGNDTVRISAILACHDADVDMPLQQFLKILRYHAMREKRPRHFNRTEHDGAVIHIYHNPALRKKIRRREADPGFYR